jgi:adenylate kinase
MNILLIGAQGSGKGTQAAALAHALHALPIASGDLFRKAFEEKTELGRMAQAFMDRGELVSDDITVRMVLQHIKDLDNTQGFVLDGFPRTIAQAQALDRGLQSFGRQLDLAMYLNVPREELLFRLAGRSLCHAQQHVYNMYSRPPKVAGICDIDGSTLYQRSDDLGAAIQRRLNIFFKDTIRLLDFYKKQQKLIEVNGNQDIDRVQTVLLNQIFDSTHQQKWRDDFTQAEGLEIIGRLVPAVLAT